MPGMDGLAALAAIKKIDRDVPVIVMSGQGGTHTVVQAMKLGATDFVCKPFEEHELDVLIASAIRQRQLTQEVASLRARLNEQSKYSTLFDNSDRMLEVRDLIRTRLRHGCHGPDPRRQRDRQGTGRACAA
jgi:two-component system C4-dicarboxylate transport response regulator DctD